MGVCSGRTRGTKITESSCDSLTLNIKPRLNIQVAAACWGVCVQFVFDNHELLFDSTWLQSARQEGRGSQRHVIGGLSWRIWGGGGRRQSARLWPCRLEEGTGSGVVCEHCPLQAPRRTMEAGRWPLTAPPPLLALSHPVQLWDGRKS